MKSFGITMLALAAAVTLLVTLAACSSMIKVESHTQADPAPAPSSSSSSGSSPSKAPVLAVAPSAPQSPASQSAPQPQASSKPEREQQPILEEPITGTNEVRPYDEQPPILIEEPSNPDPFGLMGGGEIALFVTDSASQNTQEYDCDQATALLSQIDFGAFKAAKMKQEIVPPDIMTGEAGTDGDYIQIGMPHTGMLYIYDAQSQALVIGAEGERYYDIPAKTYKNIRALL